MRRPLVLFLMMALVMVCWSALAHAAPGPWCVPNGSVGGPCPNVRTTIQAAINDAPVGATIKVGPGVAPEKITITKRLRLHCMPGTVLADTGLAGGGTLISFRGPLAAPFIQFCDIRVVHSEVGIAVPSSVSFFTLNTSQITRVGPRWGTGILVDGRDPVSTNHAKRVSIRATTVRGFDVGGDVYDAAWFNPESRHPGPVIWQDNNVGLRLTNTQGQVFYNEFRGNGIGLHVATMTTAPVGQIDLNSNTFGQPGVSGSANATAVRIDICGMWHNEMNHNDLFESPVAFRVQTLAGPFITGDRAYTEAVVRFAQFADTLICRGATCVTQDSSAFSPAPTPACFEPGTVPLVAVGDLEPDPVFDQEATLESLSLGKDKDPKVKKPK